MPSTHIVVFFIFLQLTQNIGCYAECRCRKESENSITETVGGAALSVVALVAAPILLPAVGFTAGGIAAGSYAACFQSAWFGGTINGMTGWVFSSLQSMGATGGLGLIGKTSVIKSTVAIYDTITGEKCDC